MILFFYPFPRLVRVNDIVLGCQKFRLASGAPADTRVEDVFRLNQTLGAWGRGKRDWAAKKRFKILKFKFKFPRARTFELFRARSWLYRSQILQVNTRWKALAEIYTMHSFALLCTVLQANNFSKKSSTFFRK